jgi:crotonobetainyl-CoA:carnitine CoA-transferase CaiB-like acyl-CoA transferase
MEYPCVPDVMVAETKAALHSAVGILSALLARNKTGQGQYLDVCLLDGVVSQKAVKPMANAKEEATGFHIYETKDNKYVVTAAVEPWTRRTLLEKLGRDDLVGISQGCEQERSEAITILRNIFKSKTRKEWLDLFQDVDTELSPAYSYEEAPSDPQISDRKMLVEIDCSDATKAIQYSIPMKFSETPGQIRDLAPEFGQDTEKFMSEFRAKRNQG